MAGRIPPTSRHGHDWNECTSSMQKAVRRGLEEDAVYFASELYAHGHEKYVWKRILIMVSEDIGLAEPWLPAQIHALHQNWIHLKREDKGGGAKLPMIHAILLLARARKSRLVDHAPVYTVGPLVERREVLDVAKDKHTLSGKRMGRGWDHFWEEGTLLAQRNDEDRFDYKADGLDRLHTIPSVDDPYRERAIDTVNEPGWNLPHRVDNDNGVKVHQVDDPPQKGLFNGAPES
jgi:hypothetical protein